MSGRDASQDRSCSTLVAVVETERDLGRVLYPQACLPRHALGGCDYSKRYNARTLFSPFVLSNFILEVLAFSGFNDSLTALSI